MRSSLRLTSLAAGTALMLGLAACTAPPMANTNSGYPTSTTYPTTGYPQTNYPQPTYPAGTYPTTTVPNYVEYGRVSNVEVLQTQEPARSGPGLGAVLGGVAGAVVGNQIGHGGGRNAATVIGAVGGAVAGNAVQNNNRNGNVRQSYRVSVQLDNGAPRAYDVPSTGDLRIGDRVRIENGQLYRM